MELGRFVTFSLLSCPPNVLWQSWLEETFPGYTSPSEFGTVDDKTEQEISEKAAAIARPIEEKASALARPLEEQAAALVKPLEEKAAAASSAIAENDTVKAIKRRATEGMDIVKNKAREIDERISPALPRKATADAKAVTANTTPQQSAEKEDDSIAVTPTAVDSKAAPAKKLNIKNTAIKFSLDQSIGALVNTILFIGGMQLLKGAPLVQALAAVRRV